MNALLDSSVRRHLKVRRILISEPSATTAWPFLPYVWATLKTSADSVSRLADQFTWLEPIYEAGRAAALLAPYELHSVDVLGLSCYTWNFELQCEIARQVKVANPKVVVVAGGPHPDVKDPGFFRYHPCIDVVVTQDGELTFNKVLLSICDDTPMTAVTGLYLPTGPKRVPIFTGRPDLPTQFARSPYVEQSYYFNALIEKHGAGNLNAVWETNRGCPYRCSFCDWGSNTMSKIRQFDFDRVEQEALWMSRMELKFVFLADANFGVLKRDLLIAQKLVDSHREHGGPRSLYYSPAKNNPERAVAIARAFAESNIVYSHTLAIQHTNPEVLAASDRKNISAEQQKNVALELLSAGIPADVQLILGIPGDTYERWKNCFSDLMSWGIHEDYYASFYNLLPNAPAADPSFIERWGVRTFRRRTRVESFDINRCADEELPRENIIFACNTFGAEDWVRMNIYTSFVRALHCGGLTQIIAVYLYSTHGMQYREFYELLIETFCTKVYGDGSLWSQIEQEYRLALTDDAILDDRKMNDLLGFECTLSVGRSILATLILDSDRFYGQLTDFLCDRLTRLTNLRSVVDFQRDIVIRPTYQARDGKTFFMDHDWPSYFMIARRNTTRRGIGEPADRRGSVIHAADTVCGEAGRTRSIDWSDLADGQRLRTWLSRIVCGRMAASSTNLHTFQAADRPH